ncbi:hypothetical protein J5N97_025703 [Dioscorea zingiberensis]|uniref:Uncharacterized protein n=1 Tax=Dioscorea zingiberensis TaxID=325984 RepID=A0A9D5C140_9LILI|nr:hypothetical protein J5N97_025703 [Dioscorea zingiberensis]
MDAVEESRKRKVSSEGIIGEILEKTAKIQAIADDDLEELEIWEEEEGMLDKVLSWLDEDDEIPSNPVLQHSPAQPVFITIGGNDESCGASFSHSSSSVMASFDIGGLHWCSLYECSSAAMDGDLGNVGGEMKIEHTN